MGSEKLKILTCEMSIPDELEVRLDIEGFPETAERAGPGDAGGDFVVHTAAGLGESNVCSLVGVAKISWRKELVAREVDLQPRPLRRSRNVWQIFGVEDDESSEFANWGDVDFLD
jgi:hypothetical protein